MAKEVAVRNTELTLGADGKLAVPEHLRNLVENEGNIENLGSVSSLSYEGKTWSISIGGEKHKLTRTNEDGDEEPISIMRVVILNYNQRRGRTYYEGTYDPDNVAMPVCWSEDGIKPDPNGEKVQAKTCATCPMARKGSRVTDNGKSVAACSEHRMLAVVPANKLDFEPLRLKIAATSDWDKSNPQAAQNWYAFTQYLRFLQSSGLKHTGAIVTKMKFDKDKAYPKLLFATQRWLDEDEYAQVKDKFDSPEVEALLKGTFTPNGVDGKAKDPDDEDEDDNAALPAPEPTKSKSTKKAAPVQSEADDEDDDDGDEDAVVAQFGSKAKATVAAADEEDDEDEEEQPAPPKKTKAAKKAKAAPADDEDDEDEGEVAAAPPKKAPAAKKAKAAPKPVTAIAEDWEDDDDD